MSRRMVTMDGNEAVASVAHRTNEVIAIYPITPSSQHGRVGGRVVGQGQAEHLGHRPHRGEMQSEGGAAGAVHGALQAGALTTTFTASQGLLLMIPNMYKIAGELTPFGMHVSARTLATHALSIFGDHSDVMAGPPDRVRAALRPTRCRRRTTSPPSRTRATLETRVPFLHFFDGFRTSHEVAKIELLDDDDLRELIPDELVAAHRARALSPDRPVLRGTRPEPGRLLPGARGLQPASTRSRPTHVQAAMDEFAALTGRALPALRVRRPPRGGARHRDDGLGRRGRPRDRRAPGGQRREGRPPQGPALPPLLRGALHRRRCPGRSTTPRGPRPHQGARGRSASRSTRTWSPRCARPSRPTSTASTTSST